ncbi:hypothetical protein UlMin_040539 [Ulmus minor]
MPRKRLPIFHKVTKHLKVSIFIARLRKPIIPRLVLFRKSQKPRKFKLLKHYNYGFLGEYQFSPSNSPFIGYPRKKYSHGSLQRVYSMLFLGRCLGNLRGEGKDEDSSLQLEAFEDAKVGALLEPLDCLGVEEDSIDLRAERFIERFYREMKLQRQVSL